MSLVGSLIHRLDIDSISSVKEPGRKFQHRIHGILLPIQGGNV
jgi:hypothetical protein